MKGLLVFTEVYNPGGGNRYMTDLVNAIADGYDEVVIASNNGGLYPEDAWRLTRPFTFRPTGFVTRALLGNCIRNWPVTVQKMIMVPLLFLEPLFFLVNVMAFLWLLVRLQPSRVLSCNGGYPAAAACLAMVVAARLARISVVLSVVSMPAKRRRFLWPYDRGIDWLVWGAVDLVIVNAQVIARALCANRSMPAEKFEVIYNGLEDQQPAGLARSGDKSHAPFVIGCIARMDIAKGALVLLDAFAELEKSRPQLRLVLAGSGDASAELARRCKLLGLQDRVEIMGHYAGDVGALLATFDVYVFPSLWEGFPYSIVEAMRAGVPILATRVGGIPEAITDGEEGLLVEPGSSDAIVDALQRLIDDAPLRQSLGKCARRKYENNLSLSKMHLRIGEVFAGHQF